MTHLFPLSGGSPSAGNSIPGMQTGPVDVAGTHDSRSRRPACGRPARTGISFALANESAAPLALTALANDQMTEDGWVLLAPLGEHLHRRRVFTASGIETTQDFVQVIDAEAVQALANQIDGLWGKLRRFRRTIPIYARHPDLRDKVPTAVAAESDRTEHGGITGARITARGLEVRPALNELGARAAEEQGLKYFSPFWWTTPLREQPAAGPLRVRPTSLISVGLTDRPQIHGGDALANAAADRPTLPAAPAATPPQTMNPKLIALLGLLGIPLANEADAGAIDTATVQATDKLRQQLAAAAEAQTALANERTARTTAESALANERTARATAETALANERTAHAGALVDLAIAEGRIAPSERTARLAAFGTTPETFTAARTALANQAPQWRTGGTPHTADGATRKDTDPGRRLMALANEALTAKRAPDIASALNLARQENPELATAVEAAVTESARK